MEDILNEITLLNYNECDELLKSAHVILREKKNQRNINWLIDTFNINKHFSFLNNCIIAECFRSIANDNITCLSIKYKSDRKDNDNNLLIKIDENNQPINVIYETDRYARFEYQDNHFPYGQFQGICLKDYYKDATKLTSILSDIHEVKELCQFLF